MTHIDPVMDKSGNPYVFTSTATYESFWRSFRVYCDKNGAFSAFCDGDTEPLLDVSIFRLGAVMDDYKLDAGMLMELAEEGRMDDIRSIIETTASMLPERKYEEGVWFTSSQFASNMTTTMTTTSWGGSGGSAGMAGPTGPAGVQGMSGQAVMNTAALQNQIMQISSNIAAAQANYQAKVQAGISAQRPMFTNQTPYPFPTSQQGSFSNQNAPTLLSRIGKALKLTP